MVVPSWVHCRLQLLIFKKVVEFRVKGSTSIESMRPHRSLRQWQDDGIQLLLCFHATSARIGVFQDTKIPKP